MNVPSLWGNDVKLAAPAGYSFSDLHRIKPFIKANVILGSCAFRHPIGVEERIPRTQSRPHGDGTFTPASIFYPYMIPHGIWLIGNEWGINQLIKTHLSFIFLNLTTFPYGDDIGFIASFISTHNRFLKAREGKGDIRFNQLGYRIYSKRATSH